MNRSQLTGLAVGTVAVGFLLLAERTGGNVIFFTFVLLLRDGHNAATAAVVVGCQHQGLVRSVDVGVKLSPDMTFSTATATQQAGFVDNRQRDAELVLIETVRAVDTAVVRREFLL